MTMIDIRPLVGRAFRLESHLLDQELDCTIDGLVDQLELSSYSEELKTVLRLYLFASYVDSNATAGMQVYNLHYHDLAQNIPTRNKLIALTALKLTASYMVKRCRTFDKIIQGSNIQSLKLPWLNLDNFSLLCKSFDVMNFFLFLRQGLHLTLPERILGLVPMVTEEGYAKNIQLNKVQADFMYREVIWRALAEFLGIVLPLINIERMRNKISNLTGSMPSFHREMKLSDKFSRETTRCAICMKQPFNPYLIGCMHVFCYFCIKSKYLSDPSMGYACKLCNYKTDDEMSVQRFISLNRED